MNKETMIQYIKKGMCKNCATYMRGGGNCVITCPVLEIIDKVSKEQTKWIPVSERLPKDEQKILFSTKTGRVHSGKYHDDDSANQWYSHKDKCRAWNNVVIAWMPLPEPYKTESEGKE